MLKLPMSTGRPHSDLLAVQRLVFHHPQFVMDSTLTGEERDFIGIPFELEVKLEVADMKLALAMRHCCQRLDYPARIVVLKGRGEQPFTLGVRCFAWVLAGTRGTLLLHTQVAEPVVAISGWNPQEAWSFGEL